MTNYYHCGLMQINFPRWLLDANKEKKLMVMMQIAKLMTQKTVFLKRNLKRRQLFTNYKENKLQVKRKRDIKKAMIQRISCFYSSKKWLLLLMRWFLLLIMINYFMRNIFLSPIWLIKIINRVEKASIN